MKEKKFSGPTYTLCAPARSAPASVAGSLASDRLLNRFCDLLITFEME
jgi:hypothetical protein